VHSKTRNALLALGFPTDLIEKINRNGHALGILKQFSYTGLRKYYNDEESKLINERIKRQPISDEVIEQLLKDSKEVCCYCADGVSTRPYQIHHIEPYHITQDNSEHNLVLVCPTHHGFRASPDLLY
jgi:hypothetical protein